MKKLFVIALAIFLIFTFSVTSFAYSASTYAHLSQNNTNVQNLISFANNTKGFENSDFVVAQIGAYEYRIFYGDLTYANSRVTGNEVNYISYYREGSSYDYSYIYASGVDSTLSLTIDHAVVSNIEGLGASSALYEEYQSYDDNIMFLIFGLAVLIALFFVVIRSSNK